MADIASLTSTATALAGGSSQSNSSLSKLTDDLDNFLTTLTAQLQHQDPLEPLDTHEFTNQLVQFSGVEQAIQQNKNLESIIELTQNSMAISAVSYIGKDITDLEAVYDIPVRVSAVLARIIHRGIGFEHGRR
jgi:flagellar basal-body rod modification protein FlgD